MKIKIRTPQIRLSLPIPLALTGAIIKLFPNKAWADIVKQIPQPYCHLINKETIYLLVKQCLAIFKESRGLEIVHIETSDNTFVSIKL